MKIHVIRNTVLMVVVVTGMMLMGYHYLNLPLIARVPLLVNLLSAVYTSFQLISYGMLLHLLFRVLGGKRMNPCYHKSDRTIR